MAVEYFVTPEGQVLVNEIAPRPHNSGHWTIEATVVSQFQQHIRAVAGWPLAEPVLLRPAAMANLLGDDLPFGSDNLSDVLMDPRVALHWYGKRAIRPGRKMGHITAVADTVDDARELVLAARAQLARKGDHDG
jgi:5-(carboxyamino)imidazole ribonucleotide synthase